MKRIKVKKHVKKLKFLFQRQFPELWFWTVNLRVKILNYQEYKKILREYRELVLNDEQKKCIDYIKKNGPAFRPYSWAKEYMCNSVKVYTDRERSMNYVMHNNRKLYFPSGWAKSDIFKLYNELCLEQDNRSAHCYFNTDFCIDKDSAFVDVGAAEGIIALDNIERVSKCYLIESNPDWITALQATFAPYKDKVIIIPRIASEVSDKQSVTLDELLKDEKDICVKIDVEGNEMSVLNGMKGILATADDRKIKIAVCVYHKWNDEKVISEMLKDYLENVSIAPNYLCMFKDFENNEIVQGKMPYLRHGVLRAWDFL